MYFIICLGDEKMYGAIIGDLAGSIYEFGQVKQVHPVSINKIIEKNSFYSDDTILTIAILDAILNKEEVIYYEKYIKKYIQEYKNYKPNFQPYFKTTFSSNLINWSEGKIEGKSKGNGAVMRISPVGYLFNNEWDIIRQSTLATFPSHYSYEAMDASQTIALIIYYARSGMKKEEIIYMLTKSLKYQPFTKFNTTCNETLPNCLYALFSSNSYEEAIKKVISYGGDTDTNACIVGAMAEALFGIGENLISLANQKLPTEFVNILEEGYSRIKKIALY